MDALPSEGTARPYLRGSFTALWYNQGKCRRQTCAPTSTAVLSWHPEQMRPWHPHSLSPITPCPSLLLVFPTAPTVPHFGFRSPPPSLGSKFRHSFLALALGTLAGIGPRLHAPTAGAPSPRPPTPAHRSWTNKISTSKQAPDTGADCFGRWAFCREGKVFGSTEQEGSSQPLGVSTLDFHLTVMAKET